VTQLHVLEPDDGQMESDATRPARVSETFVSLQGEGALAGTPSWFCRLSGCNLRCVWCDTPYASWEPEGTERTIEELAREARASGVRHAVLTGGEPMIFPQLAPLTEALAAASIHVTIETAGTVAPRVHFDLMSISPKLSNSTPTDDPRDPEGRWAERHDRRRLNFAALQTLIDRARARRAVSGRGAGPSLQFKFVVTDPDDLVEIDDILGALDGWRPGEIFLMPEGTAVPEPDRVRWVVETCIERGWRYAHRLHIELFGNTRGT